MTSASSNVPADIDIARKASMLPIAEIAANLGISDDTLELYGRYKAKVSLDLFHRLDDAPTGKLVLVTAITPTPAGEGKTTTSIGLADALRRIGKKAVVCLREPSMGPCFGMKGGAAGGGIRRSYRWRISTSISRVTFTRLNWLTICLPPLWITTSITAMSWGSM